MKKNILITGGAGFIGSHLVKYMLNKYPNYMIVNLDALTYAANEKSFNNDVSSSNYKFYHGNICDKELVNKIFSDDKITDVMHLAAESHVDNSIINPQIFIETNVIGTYTLLEAAKRLWINKTDNRFLHVSTDEVYGTLGAEGYFSENTPYAPNSPYSASKASSDFLVRSFFHTYNLPILISNCSNNFGPLQHDEKLIPTVIRSALKGLAIPLYGNGQNIRDWLYVLDHCKALDFIFHKGVLGESYNVGARNEKNNLELMHMLCQILDKLKPLPDGTSYAKQIKYVNDRLGHDYRYAIDNSKICNLLGWQPEFTFIKSLEDTVKWYIDYYS